MASFWQKTLFYLGLVDEGQPEQEAQESAEPAAPSQAPVRTVSPSRPGRTAGGVPGRRVEPPMSSRRRISPEPALAEAGVFVREGEGDSARYGAGESEIIEARSFSDAQLLADHLRNRTPVVFDLRATEPEMVRRLVDFASGLTYALDGSMRRVAKGVILVAPHRVTLSRDERQRLAELGLYHVAENG